VNDSRVPKLNGALEINGALTKLFRGLGVPGFLAIAVLLYNIGTTLTTIKTQAHSSCQASQQLTREIRATLIEEGSPNVKTDLRNFPPINC
jgi:hypothetical protein